MDKLEPDAITQVVRMLPAHKAGLHLSHNDHLSNYMTVEENDTSCVGHYDWVSDEEKQRAYATNEMWVLQWYPDTPVGFCALAASTLHALLKAAESA